MDADELILCTEVVLLLQWQQLVPSLGGSFGDQEEILKMTLSPQQPTLFLHATGCRQRCFRTFAAFPTRLEIVLWHRGLRERELAWSCSIPQNITWKV